LKIAFWAYHYLKKVILSKETVEKTLFWMFFADTFPGRSTRACGHDYPIPDFDIVIPHSTTPPHRKVVPNYLMTH